MSKEELSGLFSTNADLFLLCLPKNYQSFVSGFAVLNDKQDINMENKDIQWFSAKM